MAQQIPPPPPGFSIVGGGSPAPAPRAAPRRAPSQASRYSGPMPSSADALFPALIRQESGGQAGIVGPQTRYGRAIGRTQMLPATAREVAQKVGVPYREDLLRGTSSEAAQYQDRLGLAYLQEGFERTGNARDALHYYHGGPDRKLWGPKTRSYADSILSMTAQGQGEAPQLGETAQLTAGPPPPPPGFQVIDGPVKATFDVEESLTPSEDTFAPDWLEAQGVDTAKFRSDPSYAQSIMGSLGFSPNAETGKWERRGRALAPEDEVDPERLARAQDPEYQRRYADASSRAGNIPDWLLSLTGGATLGGSGLVDEIIGGMDYVGSGFNAQAGQAARDAIRDEQAEFASERPGLNLALQVGGGFATPGMGAAGNFISRGATTSAQIGRAGAVGAGVGAGSGFVNAEGNIAERAPDALVGAGIGAGAGAVIQRASPAVEAALRGAGSRIGSGFSEAGATIGRGLGRQPRNVEVTPQATDAARSYVQRLIDGSGSDIPAAIGRAGNKPITSAEAIGPRGVANLAAVSRREGRTGMAAATQLSSRAFERHNRIAQDFSDLAGLNPEGAADLVANVVTTGRTKAAPLYQAAYAQPVTPTPALERILARPHSRAAMRRAYSLARNEDRNPEDLGLFVMSDSGYPTGAAGRVQAARDADLSADLDALRAGRRTAGSGRGDSLLAFISKNGGVRDDGGDLASIGADRWNRQGAWRSRVVRDDGLSMEDMAQRARDAGYFDEVTDAAADSADNYQRLSSGDLTKAIDDELRGNARFAREPGDTVRGAAADLRKARRAALDERLNREGIDISTASNDEIASALRAADDDEARIMAHLEGDGPGAPRVELVPGEIPSVQTLDYVKRGLDAMLERYRDKTTGRLVLDDDGRAIVKTIQELRGELTSGNDFYRKALETSGDYLSAQTAFDMGERLLSPRTSARDFLKATERMTEGDRNALIAGMADKIYRDAQRGAIRASDLALPVTQQKLASLMGAPAADDFSRRIATEIEMAAGGARIAGPQSITSDVLIANAELDSANPIIEGLARGAEDGKAGVIRQALRGLYAPVGGFIRGAASPASQSTRDEIGRLLLLSPDDLLAELRVIDPGATRQDAVALARVLRPQVAVATQGATSGGQSRSQPSTQEARRAAR